MFSPELVGDPKFPISIFEYKSERKLENISTTIQLNTLVKTRIAKNIHVGASCPFDEIQTYKVLLQ